MSVISVATKAGSEKAYSTISVADSNANPEQETPLGNKNSEAIYDLCKTYGVNHMERWENFYTGERAAL